MNNGDTAPSGTLPAQLLPEELINVGLINVEYFLASETGRLNGYTFLSLPPPSQTAETTEMLVLCPFLIC